MPSSRGQRGMTHFFQVSKWSQDCRLGGHTWFLEICCLQHCGRLKVRRTGAAWLTALKDSFAGLERAVRGWGASRVRGKDWVGRSHRFCRTCCFRPKPKLLLLPRAAGQAPCVPVNNSNKEASQAVLWGPGIDPMLGVCVCLCMCWLV